MNILAYSPYWHIRGGGEKYLLSCVEALLLGGHEVTIVSMSNVNIHQTISYFNISSNGIKFATVHTQRQVRKLSANFDLFLCTVNFRKIKHKSPKAVYILQVPFGGVLGKRPKQFLKNLVRTYTLVWLKKQNVVVYSSFVKRSVERWGVKPTVIEPSADNFSSDLGKQKVILSVGRIFCGGDNNKRYEDMIKAFKAFFSQTVGWEYHICGSCNDEKYLTRLREQSEGFPIFFHTDVNHTTLKYYYGIASIFWHGAGYGNNERTHPERMEHFGISTVEAMSAGCVPVVYGGGAQPEIVGQGRIWYSLGTLVRLSLLTPTSKERKYNIDRASIYSKESFGKKFLAYIESV